MDTKLNLALLFTVSVLPDLDVFLFRFIEHRGPIHSLSFSLVVCLLFFVVYRKKAFPYFVALFSHSLVGDVFSGGVQLFWPFSTDMFFLSNFSVFGAVSVGMELFLFVVCTAVMFINKDFQRLLHNKTRWVYWLVPFGAVLGPLLRIVGPYGHIPVFLVVPSLFYLFLFSLIIGLGHKKDRA